MNTDSHVLTLSLPMLRAALLMSANTDIRYYLNGIYVDTAAGRIVGTDEHVMFVGIGPVKPDCAPFIIPRDTLESILKALKPARVNEGTVIVPNDARAATDKTRVLEFITPNDGRIKAKECDGRFPEYMRVLPTAPTAWPGARPTMGDGRADENTILSTHANPALVLRAYDAITLARDVTLYSKGGNKPHPVTSTLCGGRTLLIHDSAPGALAIVMGLNGHDTDVTGILNWAHKRPDAAA
jgi:hypothetical protein